GCRFEARSLTQMLARPIARPGYVVGLTTIRKEKMSHKKMESIERQFKKFERKKAKALRRSADPCAICGVPKRYVPEWNEEGAPVWAYQNEDGTRHRCLDYVPHVRLRVSYSEREEVKQLGAWWNQHKGYWLVGMSEDLTKFAKWHPTIVNT